MNCPSCSTPVDEGQTHCHCCGTPLNADPQAQAAYQQASDAGFSVSDNRRGDYGSVDFVGNQQSYTSTPTYMQSNNPDSTLAMVLGIVCLVCTLFSCICGCLGSVPAIICGIIGLVISIRCRKAAKFSGCSDGKATAGMVTSIIGLVLCTLSCIGSIASAGLILSEDIFS